MGTRKEKIGITLTTEELTRLDEMCEFANSTRSQLIARMVKLHYVEMQEKKERRKSAGVL